MKWAFSPLTISNPVPLGKVDEAFYLKSLERALRSAIAITHAVAE